MSLKHKADQATLWLTLQAFHLLTQWEGCPAAPLVQDASSLVSAPVPPRPLTALFVLQHLRPWVSPVQGRTVCGAHLLYGEVKVSSVRIFDSTKCSGKVTGIELLSVTFALTEGWGLVESQHSVPQGSCEQICHPPWPLIRALSGVFLLCDPPGWNILPISLMFLLFKNDI